jgi:hypothetical protein
MAAERVLTQRELNRALLARQLLLDRSPTPLPRALERVGGIQAQYAPSMYVGLWSRLAAFERATLTRALERRSVVQATLMRVTIHLVSRADFWPLAIATRDARRLLWLRSRRGAFSDGQMAQAAETVRGALAGGRRLRHTELEQLVGKDRANGVGLWVDLVRAPPSGTWERRRADLFALADDWVGPPATDEEAAVEHLVRRYLVGFGPASRADVASFTGLPARTLAPALDRLAPRLFTAEDGTELLDLPRAPLPDPDTPAPVRFLPTWDATLLVHARRTGLLPEEYRPRIFSTKNPQSLPTFLVDGKVKGAWRHRDGRIELEPFAKLDASERRELEREGERLAAFHGDAAGS